MSYASPLAAALLLIYAMPRPAPAVALRWNPNAVETVAYKVVAEIDVTDKSGDLDP